MMTQAIADKRVLSWGAMKKSHSKEQFLLCKLKCAEMSITTHHLPVNFCHCEGRECAQNMIASRKEGQNTPNYLLTEKQHMYTPS